MGFHKLVNTRLFSEAAIDWKRNGGRYTTAPKGSRDYFQYWEEQERRCKYGYKAGDIWIPGRMYDYLNFSIMSRVPESIMMRVLNERRDKQGKISPIVIEKTISFPAFWEIHYEYFNFKHIAWYGGTFMGITSPGNKHVCLLKTRGAGISYIEAADGAFNYTFMPGSKTFYFAGTEPYLVGDAIMDKVQANLDWKNQHCPEWAQNRQVNRTLMHQKASYLDNYGVERGTFSEIIGQIVDKPSKVRGKRGVAAKYEEGGSFPRMEEAVEVGLGSLKEGSDVYVGQMTLFGTGGEQGPGIQGLENIFNAPYAWDMLQFPNIWDKGAAGSQCGLFVPCYRANPWFADEDGNIDVKAALIEDEKGRKKKETSGKPKDLDRRKAEYPRTPREALQRLTGNGFNQAEVQAQISRIQTDRTIQSLLRYGVLRTEPEAPSGVDFMIQPKSIARPIEDFPHDQKDNLTGCVTVLEKPYTDEHGRTPAGMYLLSFDAYAKEDSEDQTSLWSWKVWKLWNKYSSTYCNLPVAWCAGRTTRYEDNHDRMFLASDWYNATMQGEIAGGGQSVVTHAKTIRKLHRLEHEPFMAHNKDIQSKSAGRSYLMNMPTDRKNTGITYLESWHIEPRGIDERNNLVLNVHRIYDIAFLREMDKHNPAAGNFDRISDGIVAMYMLKEKAASFRKEEREKKNGFFQRALFTSDDYDSYGMVETY